MNDNEEIQKIVKHSRAIMQQGSKELAEYLFEDGLPKCKEDIIKKISADFEDLDPKIQEHLEAWAVILVAHLTKNYK